MEQIVLNVILKPKEGKREQLLIQLKKVKDASRAEEGCVKYDLHESLLDDTFVLYEVWKDAAAVDHHIATSHYQEYREAIKDIVTSRELHRLKVIE